MFYFFFVTEPLIFIVISSRFFDYFLYFLIKLNDKNSLYKKNWLQEQFNIINIQNNKKCIEYISLTRGNSILIYYDKLFKQPPIYIF